MILKKDYRKSKGEGISRESKIRSLFNVLPWAKISSLNALKSLSDCILAEMKKFTKRNSLAEYSCSLETKEANYCCCQACLKAHLVHTAKDKELYKEIKIINNLIQSDLGHKGYYMDSGKLIKI
ncbi:MAG: hypothetical protein AABY10_01780 [Nanoarchaeota archaeon]